MSATRVRSPCVPARPACSGGAPGLRCSHSVGSDSVPVPDAAKMPGWRIGLAEVHMFVISGGTSLCWRRRRRCWSGDVAGSDSRHRRNRESRFAEHGNAFTAASVTACHWGRGFGRAASPLRRSNEDRRDAAQRAGTDLAMHHNGERIPSDLRPGFGPDQMFAIEVSRFCLSAVAACRGRSCGVLNERAEPETTPGRTVGRLRHGDHRHREHRGIALKSRCRQLKRHRRACWRSSFPIYLSSDHKRINPHWRHPATMD